jgi:hypothetical protein
MGIAIVAGRKSERFFCNKSRFFRGAACRISHTFGELIWRIYIAISVLLLTVTGMNQIKAYNITHWSKQRQQDGIMTWKDKSQGFVAADDSATF